MEYPRLENNLSTPIIIQNFIVVNNDNGILFLGLTFLLLFYILLLSETMFSKATGVA